MIPLSTRTAATGLFGAMMVFGALTCAGPRDSLKFPHKYHVLEEEIDCSDCHRDVGKSTSIPAEGFMPKEKVCWECHGNKRKQCGFCHTRPEAPMKAYTDRLRMGVRFSHKRHADADDETTCRKCHAEVIQRETEWTAPHPQPTQKCMACHRKDYREISCKKCHGGFVESEGIPLDFAAHRGDFLQKHGSVAFIEPQACAHCHAQSFCTDCHSKMAPAMAAKLRVDSVSRRFVHGADVMTVHPQEARANPDRCLTCHSQQSCTECHTARQVGAKGGPGLGPHAPGWLTPGDPLSHGPAARRDILSCVTCHDRGRNTNCITCHRVGGSGGSPHPPGWDSRLKPGESRACIWCHR